MNSSQVGGNSTSNTPEEDDRTATASARIRKFGWDVIEKTRLATKCCEDIGTKGHQARTGNRNVGDQIDPYLNANSIRLTT